MYKKTLILILTVLMVFICTGMVNAQNKRDEIWKKIEKIKVEKLIKRLDLDESTAATFKDKYLTFSNTIRELNQKRAVVYKQMAENLQSDNGLDTLVDALVNIEDRINTERKEFAAELKTILTSKQIVTMIIFERKFNTELRKLLQEYMKKRKAENN